MNKKMLTTLSIALLLNGGIVQADKPTNGGTVQADKPTDLKETIKGAIRDVVEDNADLAKLTPKEHFQTFHDIQNPRVTMLLCSDSRVQVDNFSHGAENDIFVARNIGNQYVTTKGSVEYGVNVLKTPVLLIIGHSHCGAIKAAWKFIN